MSFSDVIAVVGAVIILARIIVKLTPTPQDDSWLEWGISMLKHLGLHVSDAEKK